MLSYVLVAVGLILVAISFFVSERLEDKFRNKEEVPVQARDIWTEKEEQRVTERIEAILSEKTEEAILHTDDQLSQISNEKIMAVSDFSNQLLEKLNQNHSEVVFLYNMLGEKEEEIKKLVSRPVPVAEVPVILREASEPANLAEMRMPASKEVISGLEAASAKKRLVQQKKQSAVPEPVVPEEKEVPEAQEEITEPSPETPEENQNERILKLHESGKSILEISRELGMGQGEVKLVIDLFQGVNR